MRTNLGSCEHGNGL